jgi:tetratricopeptide (TPR) repeat protein
LLTGISAPRRERLHAGVADAIERLNPGAVSERAGEIADHLLKAGSFADGQRLVRWLTLAGNGALEAAAFEEARRNFRSALSHQGVDEPRLRADLLGSLAMAERGLDQWDEVLANLQEALEIYINLRDREMIVRTFNELTDALFWTGRFQEAAEAAGSGLTYLQADISADRARLLAALGQAHASGGDYKAAQQALREALNIASELSDRKLEARVLGTRSIANVHFLRLEEAAADGFLSEQLGGLETPPWQRGLQLLALYQALLFLGRPDHAAKIAAELEPLAGKIGQAYSVASCVSTRVWVEFGKAPDLAKLEPDLLRVRNPDHKALYLFWEPLFEVQLSLLDFFRGNWASALLHAQASCRSGAATAVEGLGVGALFRQMAYGGERDGACAIFNENRTRLPLSGQPNTLGSWWMLALVIEGFAMLNERSRVAELYPLARELISTGAVSLWPISRFTQTIAGVAAAAARQWEAAEDHFQIAMQQAESFPNRLEQTEIYRFHAMMLIGRAAVGDRDKARTLLSEALQSYERIGMPHHVEMTQTLLARCQ